MRGWILALLSCALLGAQTVEESFSRDPGPLDFIRGEGHEQAILQALTGDALVGLDARGNPVPRLAQGWDSRSGILRIRLRPARFSDGSPLRIQDVLWTFRQIQSREEASPTKRAILQGVRASSRGGILELASSKPSQRLLRELARVPIAREGREGMGTGPYSLERRGSEWFLQARKHFLAPRIQAFHFRHIAEDQGILQALRKGWLSIGVPPPRSGLAPPPSHVQLVQATHAQLVVWSAAGTGPLRLLQRWRGEAFPPALLGSTARPSRGLWPESLGFPARELKAVPEPPRGKLELLYSAGDTFVSQLLLALGERARKDGFHLELVPVESGLLYQRLQKRAFQLACALVIFDPHPWSVLEYLEEGGPMNFGAWTHPRREALLRRLDSPGSPAWDELQDLWAGSAQALPILDFHSVVWVDKRLKVEPSPLGLYLSTPGPAGWSWTP